MLVGKSNFSFCAAHRIHGHAGKCRSLHGHNYRVSVAVRGDDAANMVIDFSTLKTVVKSVVDSLDHCTILAHDDPLSAVISNDPDTHVVGMQEPPTVEALCRLMWCMLTDRLYGFANVRLARLTIYETDDSFAEMLDEGCGAQLERNPTQVG